MKNVKTAVANSCALEYHSNLISVLFMPLPSLYPQTFAKCFSIIEAIYM